MTDDMKDGLSKEGRFTVMRDSRGEIVTKVLTKKTERETWRSLLKKLTDGGQMPMLRVVEIARGDPFIVTLEDGSKSAPVIAPLSTQLVAAQWLHEQMFGKAVAQTEVMKAEAETELQAQFQALTDDELQRKVFEAMKERGLLPGGEVVETQVEEEK